MLSVNSIIKLQSFSKHRHAFVVDGGGSSHKLECVSTTLALFFSPPSSFFPPPTPPPSPLPRTPPLPLSLHPHSPSHFHYSSRSHLHSSFPLTQPPAKGSAVVGLAADLEARTNAQGRALSAVLIVVDLLLGPWHLVAVFCCNPGTIKLHFFHPPLLIGAWRLDRTLIALIASQKTYESGVKIANRDRD
ncbi:hypothetical protein EGR_10925 [Echinococcus granulosus]|uniref:Uncharacterized protein n=1 Tax=Echinococcus granulosus TaxID=6210 RepID=W6TZG8_ECHGR|nr:hypothetical protein EGR_10925 [Echinococcus granulosus]EUB54215.1 hypothetical protein EGR_10925 [Echinococcus granulosus]